MGKKRGIGKISSGGGNTVEGEYVLDAATGVRSVKAYVHEYTAYAKGRWLGREIIDVVTREFGSHPPAYWSKAIRTGLVRVNRAKVSESYKFRNGDSFVHLAHRHEPPVMGSLSLVGETESLLAVCKPPSMPMHPCGAYRHNSLMFVLEREPLSPTQGQPLFLVHRLDRVTSGVVILAKSKQAAGKISAEIASHQTEKTYLARVKGKFPGDRLDKLRRLDGTELVDMAATFSGEEPEAEAEAGPAGTDEAGADDDPAAAGAGAGAAAGGGGKRARREAPSSSYSSTNTSYSVPRVVAPFDQLALDPAVGYGYNETAFPGFLLLRVPIAVVSHREGIHCCDAQGKTSISAFRSLGYCPASDTSLVECRPLSGRTHQLRLHLQFLGTPIANDPCYGGELFYGERAKRSAAIGAVRKMRRLGLTPLSRVPHFDQTEADGEDESKEEETGGGGEEGALAAREEDDSPQAEGESLPAFLARTCQYCRLGGGDSGAELERLMHCDGIWLHAQRYRHGAGEWSFEAPVPAWAKAEGFRDWS